jgi:hypothetical protein
LAFDIDLVDPGFRSPLVDFFRRGEVARDVRLLAAQGALAPRAQEQLALLVLLSDDADPEIRRATEDTLDQLPLEPLRAFVSRSDVPAEMRKFFVDRGVEPMAQAEAAALPPVDFDEPLLDTLSELPDISELPEDPGPAGQEHKMLSSLPVLDRMKLAMKGSREQRAVLIRDSNKLVSAAVLSSPKINDAEIEAFTKMGNVSEDVLRIIGQNRSWLKNYGVAAGLCRHPKTPPAISMQLLYRLTEKDLKMLAIDRNAKEGLRLLAKKILSKGKLG